MATLKEVAKLAGGNISTASRALNDSPSISAATKVRVRQAAEELGYRPNLSARALSGKGTGAIALVVSDIMSPVWNILAGGACDAASAASVPVLLYCAETDADYLDRVLPEMISTGAAGAVLGLHLSEEAQRKTEASGLPAVLAECFPLAGLPAVYSSRYDAAREAAAYLQQKGAKTVVLVTVPGFDMAYNKGCADALKDTGARLRVLTGPNTYQAGFALGYSLADELYGPTGIVAVCDGQALGVQHALQNRGVRVPQDCAILSLEDSVLATATYPGLTTMSKPLYRIGAKAAEKLLLKIKGQPVESECLRHTLTVRKSTL